MKVEVALQLCLSLCWRFTSTCGLATWAEMLELVWDPQCTSVEMWGACGGSENSSRSWSGAQLKEGSSPGSPRVLQHLIPPSADTSESPFDLQEHLHGGTDILPWLQNDARIFLFGVESPTAHDFPSRCPYTLPPTYITPIRICASCCSEGPGVTSKKGYRGSRASRASRASRGSRAFSKQMGSLPVPQS